MNDHDERRKRLGRLKSASDRYVSFWGIVCFAGFFLIGWPTLIAWVGLAWAMDQFVQAMRGGDPD